MQITISTQTGKKLSLEVEESDTVLKVKQKIEESEGIPADQQRLIHESTLLNDERSLSYYDIKKDATLRLILSLRGD